MRSEPCGSVPFSVGSTASDRVPVGVDQHLAAADMVGLADEAVLLHPLDEARRAVVADAQLALQVGSRGFLALGDDLHRLAVELGLGIVLAGRLAIEQIAAVFGLLGHGVIVFGRALPAP